MEARLFADPAALTDELQQTASRDEHYQLLLADHSHLSESAEQEFLAIDPGLCGRALCKVSLDWADGLPHGKETLWDTVLSRPVTWRKLTELLQPATVATTRDVDDTALASGQVLVVEDALPLQLVTQARLEKLGYQVEVASNGREAVEAIERSDFGLVLMDIQMPEMDGIAATRVIRSMPAAAKASTPIIALTANAMKGDEEEYLAAGMNGYLTKPIDRESLISTLQRWMT